MQFSDVYRFYEGESKWEEEPSPVNPDDIKALLFDKRALPLDSKVPKGPWINDLNNYPYFAYSFTRNGLRCCILKTPNLTWNGYVDIEDRDIDSDELRIHGGITGGAGDWIGFDCYHGGDLCPMFSLDFMLKEKDWSYKTFAYVVKETQRLADQIE